VNAGPRLTPTLISSTSAASDASGAHRWLIVVLLFLASLINYLDRATVSMALPLISHDLGLDPARKGLLLSAFFWSYALMQVPIGWCADRFNLRWLYAGAFALWSLAQGLTGFAGSLGVMIIFRILLGIGESVYLPGGTKIVSLLFHSAERGLPCGVFDFGSRIGMVVGGLSLPWLLIYYGWRWTFILVGFIALTWLIPWLLVFPARLGSGGSGPPATRQETAQPGRRGVTFNRNLLGICLGFFCFDYYWYLFVTWLPDYLVTVRHLTILRAGLYAALPYLVFGVSEPIGGWVADRLIRFGWDETRTRKGIVTIAFLTGLLLIPASHVESANAAIALLVGASLVGLSIGNLLVILQTCAPPEQVGVWTGMQNFAGNIGGIIAPLVTGLLIRETGSYAPAFALAAVVLVTGLLAYWFIVGRLKPARS
jgi:ACS family D-galactonate transporter-like MFS transporter